MHVLYYCCSGGTAHSLDDDDDDDAADDGIGGGRGGSNVSDTDLGFVVVIVDVAAPVPVATSVSGGSRTAAAGWDLVRPGARRRR
jgi:hypothetical protein